MNFEIVSQMQSRRLRVELLLQSIEVATGLVKVIHGIILSYDFDSRICMTAACERISTRGPPTLCLAREVVDFDLRMLCFVHVEERLEHLQKSTKTQTGIFTVHCTYCCLTFYASHRCPANDCFAHDRRMCAFCKRFACGTCYSTFRCCSICMMETVYGYMETVYGCKQCIPDCRHVDNREILDFLDFHFSIVQNIKKNVSACPQQPLRLFAKSGNDDAKRNAKL